MRAFTQSRAVMAAAAGLALLLVLSFDLHQYAIQGFYTNDRLPSPLSLNLAANYTHPPFVAQYNLSVGSCDPTLRNWHTYETFLDSSTPVPPITVSQLKQAMTCWATQGAFKKDTCLYASEDYLYQGIIYKSCNHSLSRLEAASRYWSPDPTCGPGLPFRHLDGMELCHAIKGRNVLVVGDSLSAQVYVDLLALIQRSLILHGGPGAQHVIETTSWENSFPCTRQGFSIIYAQTIGICEGTGYSPFTLTFVRNDYISIVDVVSRDVSHLEFIWQPHLHNNSIVILNTGLHYRSDSALIKSYNATLDYLKDNFLNSNDKGKLVILRNTSPGISVLFIYLNALFYYFLLVC